ncbi:unnamed protein product, partial [Mycena citricolor]
LLMDSDTEEPSDSAEKFRSSIAQFSFQSLDRDRRSTKRTLHSRDNEALATPLYKSSVPSSSRLPIQNRKHVAKTGSPTKNRTRPYAPPEVYAHLNSVPDHLKGELDVIFCGINPGKMSAETGHHYGNRSNHFWWCLHQSGLTDTQLPPSDSQFLPDRFSLGLTNLVDRPTIQQTELSKSEQLANAPIFLAKIARYRPRAVCFVGLAISKILDAHLGIPPDTSGAKSWGLRPYKMVHDSGSVSETVFFAAPSTSGLVTQFQAKIFRELKHIVEDIKVGTFSSEGMIVIHAPPALVTLNDC